MFSLEDRPAPGLYLIAWLLSLAGVVTIFIATLAASGTARAVLGVGGTVALGLGFTFAAGYQVLARRDRAPGRYRGPSPLIAFGVVLAASTVLASALVVAGIDATEPVGFLLGLTLTGLSYAGVVWLLVVRTGALTWTQMRWPSGETLRGALDTIGNAILVTIPATFALLIVAGVVATLLRVQPNQTVPTPSTSLESLAVGIAVAFIAPIGEELFFRGYSLTAWLLDLGPRAALIRSAVFFALVHIVNVTGDTFAEGFGRAVLEFAVILPLGLLLGWLFLRRGILASITGHITYNGVLLVLLFVRAQTGGS